MSEPCQVVIIHNRDRTDRMARLQEELASQNLDETFSIHWQDAIIAANPMEGISKAHRACVQRAKDDQWPFVLVLEDDVRFLHHNALKDFVERKTKLPKEWDLYLAGAYWFQTPTHIPQFKGLQFIPACDFAGMQCYAVHSRFYDTFLNAPDNYHIDRWLGPYGKAKSFIYHPFVAMQHHGWSDQKQKHMNWAAFEAKLPLWQPS